MTWMEYAIARAYAQLVYESERRALSPKELRAWQWLGKIIENFEADDRHPRPTS